MAGSAREATRAAFVGRQNAGRDGVGFVESVEKCRKVSDCSLTVIFITLQAARFKGVKPEWVFRREDGWPAGLSQWELTGKLK